MFSPTSGNSNINLKNILNRKRENYDLDDSDTATNIGTHNEKTNQNSNNKLRNTYNKNSATTLESVPKPKIANNRSISSDSNSSLSSVKEKGKNSPFVKSPSPINKKVTNDVRNLKSNSPESSRSRTRTRSYSSSRSRSRSSSKASSKSLDSAQNKVNLNGQAKMSTKNTMSRQPVFNGISAERKRASETQLNKRTFSNTRPYAKQPSSNSRRPQMHSQQRAPEQYSKTAVKVMSAQRLKNNDLQNRIAEMNLEIEKLKEENKTLKRVHHREEIALKKFEAQDNDIAQIVKNHLSESTALKEVVKKVKNENRKLTGSLMEKDEEIRAIKKKQEEYKQIINDKKLLDSVELAKKLEQANNSLSEYKKKNEQLEHKLEMIEKNHKHEIGVELAHHKETQRQLQKLSDDNRELKVRLEEKERALDLTNIYSRQFSNRDKEAPSVPLWKTSTQSLNNDSPHDKRKEYERKRKEQKNKNMKKDNKNTNIKEHEVLDLGDIVNSSRSQPNGTKHEKGPSVFMTENDEIELEKQKNDILRKQQELELKLKQQDEELKKKDAIERAKRQQQAAKEEEKNRILESENVAKKQKEEIRQDYQPMSHELNELKEKEKKKREKENLEEEERKKRWISQSTINTIDQNLDKNTVDKAKKDELLAKLTSFNSSDSKKMETPSEDSNIFGKNSAQPFSNTISSNHNHAAEPMASHSKNNNFSNTSKSNNNDIVFNFASTSNQSTNSSLPPKPLQQQKFQPHVQTNSNEYKHSLEVENLHEGKPVNHSRDTNKNELLNKLFGDSSSSQNTNTFKQSQTHQSKLDKVDDIFASSKTTSTPPVSSKVNLLPWEIQDINFNTNTTTSVKRENSNAKSNSTSNNNNSKQDHFDFFSKLNSKNETLNNGFKPASSNHSNGINRPKLENRINFSPNNRNNNYVEDIEELTL